MTHWQPIETVPENETVIGLREFPDGGGFTAIVGQKYDMLPNAIVNRDLGKWQSCTHWAWPPVQA
jgi:hypothetical protein